MTKADGKLGLLECVTILIGGMIGSAIFSLSGLTMFLAGPASVVSWMVAGIIMLVFGMLVCELSCRYPRSGGIYVFPREAFGEKYGRFWGWLSCWGAILTNIVAVAFGAIYVGTYLGVAFPGMGEYPILLALVSILLCYIANAIEFSTTGKINNIIVVLLVVTILTYVFSAFFNNNYSIANFSPFFTQGINGGNGVFSAVPIAIIGYSSVNAMAFMVSEVRNPERDISRSMIISVLVVIGIYSLVIISTMGLITTKYLIDNPEMRYIPLFAACFEKKIQAMSWLKYVVSISATIALMTTILVCVSMNARTLKAASDDGMLPSFLGKLNKNKVPAISAAITCVFAGIIACFPKMTQEIVNFGAIFNVFTLVITILAFIIARKNNKTADIAFKAPGGNFTAVTVLIVLLLCNASSIFSGGASMWIYTGVFFAIGLVIYWSRHGFSATKKTAE